MWPWQRTRHADRPAERSAEGSAVGPAVDAGARSPAWSALPPIQRSFDPLRPVSPQQEFGDSLVSWRNPSFLAPLGHLVSADAPAGVIHRLIEPAAPSSDHPAGPALTFATVEPRRGVVQRMVAAFPWASQAQGYRGPDSADIAPAQGETPPATDPVAPPVPRPLPVAPVQRSEIRPAPMIHAPSPAMPVLELPVIATQSIPTDSAVQTAGEPEPVAAGSSAPAPAAEHSPLGDSDVGEAPTLGLDSLPSPVQRTDVDGGAGGAADVTGQEHRPPAPAVETSGRPAPRHLAVQQIADSALPTGDGEAPTLGLDSPPSPVQRTGVDGGAGRSADVTGQERRGSASDAETSEGSAPLTPMVQRVAGVSPGSIAVPSPPAGSKVAEAPTLGVGPPPSTIPSTSVDGDASGPTDVIGQERRPLAPAVETSSRPAPRHLAVQQIADSALPPGDGEAPTLGLDSLPSPVQRTGVDGGAGGSADVTDQERRVSAYDAETAEGSAAAPTLGFGPPPSTVQRAIADDTPANPMVQRRGTDPVPSVTSPPGLTGGGGTPRRLGLGPPLVAAPTLPPRPGGPPEAGGTGIGGTVPEGMGVVERTVESPLPFVEEIAPLLGQSGSAAVQRDAAAGPLHVEPPPPILPILPVLQVHDSSVAASEPSPPADTPPTATAEPASSAPITSAHPVVARLVGDRTPPLLTAPSPTQGSASPAERPRQDLHGAASSVQRSPAEPPLPGDGSGRDRATGSIEQLTAAGAAVGAPLRAAGYPNGGAAGLPVQLTTMVGRPAPLAVQRTPTVGYPAPVVQTAPQEPAPAEMVLPEAPSPGGAPAQDVPPGAVAGGPGEPDKPDQTPTTAGAAAAAGGAAAGGASPDELVKKLFDPLLRRLKTELRLDRERRGMLTDLRH